MKILLFSFMYFTVITLISASLGLIQFELPQTFEVPDPGEGHGGPLGGLLDAVDSVLAPLKYVFAAIGGFIQILTFRMEGVPTEVNLLMIVPPSLGVFYTTVRLIRGGG